MKNEFKLFYNFRKVNMIYACSFRFLLNSFLCFKCNRINYTKPVSNQLLKFEMEPDYHLFFSRWIDFPLFF